jgi:hypothetical protein
LQSPPTICQKIFIPLGEKQLPSRDDLKKVVVDYGGLFTTYGDKNWDSLTDKNSANKSYQACYKQYLTQKSPPKQPFSLHQSPQ